MFAIKIKTDNAAFDDGQNGAMEIARILEELANRIKIGYYNKGEYSHSLRDINGNKVGEIKWS